MTQVSAEKASTSPPRRSTVVETGDHFPLSRKLAAVGCQPQQDQDDCTPTVRQRDDDHDNREKQRISDPLGHRQSLRRQRHSEKDRAELKDKERRQTGISDPILPSLDRSPSVIYDRRAAPIAVHCREFPCSFM
jgi:hypothetical protein